MFYGYNLVLYIFAYIVNYNIFVSIVFEKINVLFCRLKGYNFAFNNISSLVWWLLAVTGSCKQDKNPKSDQ